MISQKSAHENDKVKQPGADVSQLKDLWAGEFGDVARHVRCSRTIMVVSTMRYSAN